MPSKPREYVKYVVTVGQKIVHGGITKDPERRAQEHKKTWPTGRFTKVGRKTTEDAARQWEKRNGFS